MLMFRLIYQRRPLLFAILSLVAIILLVMLTSPVSNILMGLLFFGLALVFLISLGYFVLGLGGRTPSRGAKLRITLISTFLVLAAMFLSVQTLNWATGLTLTLLAIGMLFYTSRRA